LGSAWSSVGADFTKVEWSRFDAWTGLRTAFFCLTPLLVGLATDQAGAGVISSIGALNEGVVSTLGALNLGFTEGPAPSRTKVLESLLTGCAANAVAFSLGTLVGTTATIVAVPLVALGVSAAMVVRLRPGLEAVGTTAAVVFTVGVGLPGGGVAAAGTRFWLVLGGGIWAVVGALLQLWAQHGGTRPPAGAPQPRPSRSTLVVNSLAVGVTVGLGLGAGAAAGLTRDYWVMLTVVMSLRFTPFQTVSFTFMRVAGTAAGAMLALVVTLGTGEAWVLFGFLGAFAFLMFATRNVNLVIFTFFLTSFIIVLLNLAFPGSWNLALVRVVDVAIGGGLALAASFSMWLATRRPTGTSR